MNIDELEKRLEREGVIPEILDLHGYGRVEGYCIEKTKSGWSVYYRERGARNREHVFQSEDEACRFLMGWVLDDPTTRY